MLLYSLNRQGLPYITRINLSESSLVRSPLKWLWSEEPMVRRSFIPKFLYSESCYVPKIPYSERPSTIWILCYEDSLVRSSSSLVYSTVYSDADHRKHQSSVWLAPAQMASNAEFFSIWWRHNAPSSGRNTRKDDLTNNMVLLIAKINGSLIIGIYPAASARRHVIMSPSCKMIAIRQCQV